MQRVSQCECVALDVFAYLHTNASIMLDENINILGAEGEERGSQCPACRNQDAKWGQNLYKLL